MFRGFVTRAAEITSIIQFFIALIAALTGITILRDVSISIKDLYINLRPLAIMAFFLFTLCSAATVSKLIVRASHKDEAPNVILVIMSLLAYSWMSLITIQWMITGNIGSREADPVSLYFIYAVVSCLISILFIYLRSKPYQTTRYERRTEYISNLVLQIPVGEKTVPVTESTLKIDPFLTMLGQAVVYFFLYYPSLLGTEGNY